MKTVWGAPSGILLEAYGRSHTPGKQGPWPQRRAYLVILFLSERGYLLVSLLVAKESDKSILTITAKNNNEILLPQRPSILNHPL